MRKRRAFIVNHVGLGNGILTLPLLQRLEEVYPGMDYFYPDNPVFRIHPFMEQLNIQNLAGLFPPGWRRFNGEDAEEIRTFLETNDIDLIINLRNESPKYDIGYYKFKDAMQGSGVEFWEMDFNEIKSRDHLQHVVEDQLGIFRKHDLELEPVNWSWMMSCFQQDKFDLGREKQRIGLFVVSSQVVKQLPASSWVEIGRNLLSTSDNELVIYGSSKSDEREMAGKISADLQQEFGMESCRTVISDDLLSFCQDLSANDVVVSNDSVGVHAAAALGIPVVGIYISSIGTIWGGVSKYFGKVQGNLGKHCHFQKEISGSCQFYYGGCPAPCRYSLDLGKIVEMTQQLMKQPITDNYES